MSGILSIQQRHGPPRVSARGLRRLALRSLRELFPQLEFDLVLHVVGADEMSRVNKKFLRHAGSTDVITFDYAANEARPSRSPGPGKHSADVGGSGVSAGRAPAVCGEIFICMDEAVLHARRFRTSWQREVARYVIHAMLHLRGFTDLHPAGRRKMKREEDRLLRKLGARGLKAG